MTEPLPVPSAARRSVWAARRVLGATPVLTREALAFARDWMAPGASLSSMDARADRRRRDAEAFHRLALATGGLMIKIGQAVASRADLVPPEWVDVLCKLEDRVPPRPFTVVEEAVERELGRPLGDVFERLDQEAVAAASLAQVHRGRLRDGREVAVKVLYPGIEDEVLRDLALLPWLLALILPHDAGVDVAGLVDELQATVPAELDLVHEGRNADRIREVLAHRADVVVPEIVWPLTTRRVLVMEYVDGIKITDVAAIDRAGIDRQTIAEVLVDVYCEQVLEAGVFHADAHPGNLLVLPGPRLALLDFGLVKTLPDPVRRALARLIQSVGLDDVEETLAAFHDLGFRTAGDARAPLLALRDMFLGSFAAGRGYVDPGRLQAADRRLREAATMTPVRAVPGDLTLVARVMGALSGIGKQLDSRVDVPLTMLMHT